MPFATSDQTCSHMALATDIWSMHYSCKEKTACECLCVCSHLMQMTFTHWRQKPVSHLLNGVKLGFKTRHIIAMYTATTRLRTSHHRITTALNHHQTSYTTSQPATHAHNNDRSHTLACTLAHDQAIKQQTLSMASARFHVSFSGTELFPVHSFWYCRLGMRKDFFPI